MERKNSAGHHQSNSMGEQLMGRKKSRQRARRADSFCASGTGLGEPAGRQGEHSACCTVLFSGAGGGCKAAVGGPGGARVRVGVGAGMRMRRRVGW